MNLSHYTRKELKKVRSIEQRTPEYVSAYEKPEGLWVSVDGEDDWASWCEAESFEDMSELRRYRIELEEGANVLRIPSDMSLKHFEKKYAMPTKYRDFAICWGLVAQKYDGVIIAPYQWEHRMSSNWYYGWDCASGCIWNARAVAKVEELERLKRLER